MPVQLPVSRLPSPFHWPIGNKPVSRPLIQFGETVISAEALQRELDTFEITTLAAGQSSSLVQQMGDALVQDGYFILTQEGLGELLAKYFPEVAKLLSTENREKFKDYEFFRNGLWTGYKPCVNPTDPSLGYRLSQWLTSFSNETDIYPKNYPEFEIQNRLLSEQFNVISQLVILSLAEYFESNTKNGKAVATRFLNMMLPENGKPTQLHHIINYPALSEPELVKPPVESDGRFTYGNNHKDASVFSIVTPGSVRSLYIDVGTGKKAVFPPKLPSGSVAILLGNLGVDIMQNLESTDGKPIEMRALKHSVRMKPEDARSARQGAVCFVMPNLLAQVVNLINNLPIQPIDYVSGKEIELPSSGIGHLYRFIRYSVLPEFFPFPTFPEFKQAQAIR